MLFKKELMLLVLLISLSGSVAIADDSPLVLARYGKGEQVTLADFANRYPVLVSWLGLGVEADKVQHSLEEMLFDELLAREAEVNGIADRPEIKAKIKRMIANTYLRSRIPRESIIVEEQDLKDYYRKHSEKYAKLKRWKLSHVLLESKAEAEKLTTELRSGLSFEKLAKDRSLDPYSAKHGGNLGWVVVDALDPALAKAAAKLKEGKLSKPVKTQFGYHIVRADKKPEAGMKSFESVEKEIHREVFRSKEQALVDSVRNELWKKYDVSFDKESLKHKVTDTASAINSAPGPVSLPKTKTAKSTPTQLRLISENLDLGTIEPKPLTQSCLIANSGDDELVIQRVGSTCKCIEAKIEPRKLKPGEVGKLTFTFDPTVNKQKGLVNQVIYIESTDKVQARKLMRINADIKKG